MHLFSHRDIHGATLIEIMGMLAIVGLGIAGLLGTIGGGITLSKNTEDNIKAISIAREGIEGVMNIRDTNWLRFSSDKINCWKTISYGIDCINNPGFTQTLSGTYISFIQNGAWYLSGIVGGTDPYTGWDAYRDIFSVGIDGNGFSTQTGNIILLPSCSSTLQIDCRTVFTREVHIVPVGTGTLNIDSIVYWRSQRLHEVRLSTTLTNWKSNF